MTENIATGALEKIVAASRPREPAKASGHMRERIAVAIRGSRPSYYQWKPDEAYSIFLHETQNMREMYERWADDLLRHFDVLGLELIDTRINGEQVHGESGQEEK